MVSPAVILNGIIAGDTIDKFFKNFDTNGVKNFIYLKISETNKYQM